MSVLHIYSRVSSDSQEENTSLRNQQEKGISLASRLGFEHKVWNEGVASSAKDTLDNRPVLQSLLKQIQDGEVRHLYTEYSDRLSRNQQTWAAIRYTIKDNDVLYYSGSDEAPVDLSDPTDNLLFGILSELSSFDNAQRTRRLHTGKFNRVKEGRWLGGPTPFGYRIALDKTIEIEPEEAIWVKKAHDYIAEKKTIRDIRELFRENFVRTRRGNMVWSVGSIEKMLQNTHHGGYYVVTDHRSNETYRIDCAPIVSKDLRQTVDRYFANRGHKNRVRAPRLKQPQLLSDYLYCGCDCADFKWRGKHTKTSSVYYCPSREEAYRTTNPDQESCAGLKSIKIAETDDLVWGAVIESMSISNIFKETVKQSALKKGSLQADEKQLKQLKRKLKENEKDLKKTTEGIGVLRGRLLVQDSKEELRAAVNSLEVDRETLRSEIQELRNTIDNAERGKKWVDWVGDLDERMVSLRSVTDIKERLEFLEEVVEKIYVKTLDKKANLVELDIRFKLPYIGDALNHKRDVKSGGYELVEGSTSLKKELVRSDGRIRL
jgi:site-specific DNA recombinase